jgi:hypothetical protein
MQRLQAALEQAGFEVAAILEQNNARSAGERGR